MSRMEIAHLKKQKKILDKQTNPLYADEKEVVNSALHTKTNGIDDLKTDFKLKRKGHLARLWAIRT